jgi:hypothetical protein
VEIPSTVNCHSLRWYPVLTTACSLQSIASFPYRWFSSQACSQLLIHRTCEMSAPKVGPADDPLAHMVGRALKICLTRTPNWATKSGTLSTIFLGGTGNYLPVPVLVGPFHKWSGTMVVENIGYLFLGETLMVERTCYHLMEWPNSEAESGVATGIGHNSQFRHLFIRPQHGPPCVYTAQLSIVISGKSC